MTAKELINKLALVPEDTKFTVVVTDSQGEHISKLSSLKYNATITTSSKGIRTPVLVVTFVGDQKRKEDNQPKKIQ